MIVLSPSQINNFIDCARKWGFISLEKRPVEQKPSAALGSDTHAQLETYLNGGQFDYTRPSGYIAASGVQHLPVPKTPGMRIESKTKFKFQSPGGFWYTGIRDVYIPAGFEKGITYSTKERPLIIDHKTTSGLAWAKTKEQLQTDPQAIIYAFEANAPLVDLRWVYYQTKGARKSLPVDATIERVHAVRELQKIEELTSRHMVAMVELHRSGKLHVLRDLPANPDACDKFGKCPFISTCNLGPDERLRAVMNRFTPSKIQGDLMGLIDSLRNNAPAATTAEPAATPTPPPVTAAPSTGVNPPPDATPSDPTARTASTETPAAAPAEELKGAKKSAATRAAKKAAQAQAPTEAPEPILDGAAAEKLALAQGQLITDERHRGYTLYIDCAPNHDYLDVSDLYAQAKAAVNAKSGLPDYRMIEYGAGPGYLATAVEDCLTQDCSGLTDLVASTQSQETHACLAVLIKHATRVVRATR